MLGLSSATLKKLKNGGFLGPVRGTASPFSASLCEIFHENTKLTSMSLAIEGARIQSFFESPIATELAADPFKIYGLESTLRLPTVEPSNQLERAIVERRSKRKYLDEPMSLDNLAKILHFTYGLTAQNDRYRPVASGGGLYPLEIYVTALNVDGLSTGLYHYNVEMNGLDPVRMHESLDPLRKVLWLGDIENPEQASVIISLSAVLRRNTIKYSDRGYRMVLFEAGAVMHNIALISQSLGFGLCPLGGFIDNDLSDYLGIDGVSEVPLVPLVLGRCASSGTPGHASEPRSDPQ